MDSAAARRLVEAVEHELAMHRRLLKGLRDTRPGEEEEDEFDLPEAMRRATGPRRAALSAIAGPGASWNLAQTMAALPAEERAKLRELRREFGAVLVALSAESRKRAPIPAIAS